MIPTEWVRRAMERWTERDEPGPMTALGVDVSRGGSDKAVLAPRHGWWFDQLHKIPGAETAEASRITRVIVALISREERPPRINVDADGNGAGLVESLRDRHIPHAEVRAGRAARVDGTPYTDRSGLLTFRDWRSWMWWRFRELLDPASGLEVALPPDAELRAELCAPRWETQLSGLKVEQKSEIKKRLGRSTDSADAVVMAAIETVAPGQEHIRVSVRAPEPQRTVGVDGRRLREAPVSVRQGVVAKWPGQR